MTAKQDMLYTVDMMNFGYGPMMGWNGGGWFGTLGFLTWIVWLAVGVLLVIWLWQKVNGK